MRDIKSPRSVFLLSYLASIMTQFRDGSHEILMAAGYSYEDGKYFNRGTPSWDVETKMDDAKRQGAFPSRNIEEFRAQDNQWIEAQWAKIEAKRAAAVVTEKMDTDEKPKKENKSKNEDIVMEDATEEEKPKKEKKKKSVEAEEGATEGGSDEEKEKKKKKKKSKEVEEE